MEPGGAADAVKQTLTIIQGRWKIEILFWLFRHEVVRYSDFGRLVPGLSQRILSKQLRALESDGVILRTVHPTVPPQVDYRLTDRGAGLLPALAALKDWNRSEAPG